MKSILRGCLFPTAGLDRAAKTKNPGALVGRVGRLTRPSDGAGGEWGVGFKSLPAASGFRTRSRNTGALAGFVWKGGKGDPWGRPKSKPLSRFEPGAPATLLAPPPGGPPTRPEDFTLQTRPVQAGARGKSLTGPSVAGRPAKGCLVPNGFGARDSGRGKGLGQRGRNIEGRARFTGRDSIPYCSYISSKRQRGNYKTKVGAGAFYRESAFRPRGLVVSSWAWAFTRAGAGIRWWTFRWKKPGKGAGTLLNLLFTKTKVRRCGPRATNSTEARRDGNVGPNSKQKLFVWGDMEHQEPRHASRNKSM